MKFRWRPKGIRRAMAMGSQWLEEKGWVGADRLVREVTVCYVDILVR